jgi:hypothetical protein
MAAHRNKKFDRVYGRYLVGESMASISRSMGTCPTVVTKAFARRGFKKTNRWLTTKEQRDMICFLFKTGKYTRTALAKMYGYKSYVSISYILEKNKG